MRKSILVLSLVAIIVMLMGIVTNQNKKPVEAMAKPGDVIRLDPHCATYRQYVLGWDGAREMQFIDANYIGNTQWQQDSIKFWQNHKMPVWNFARHILTKCEWDQMVKEHQKRLQKTKA
ncbi:MAG: hypothetical protein WCT27_02650 [Patescibacteria group bacterium]